MHYSSSLFCWVNTSDNTWHFYAKTIVFQGWMTSQEAEMRNPWKLPIMIISKNSQGRCMMERLSWHHHLMACRPHGNIQATLMNSLLIMSTSQVCVLTVCFHSSVITGSKFFSNPLKQYVLAATGKIECQGGWSRFLSWCTTPSGFHGGTRNSPTNTSCLQLGPGGTWQRCAKIRPVTAMSLKWKRSEAYVPADNEDSGHIPLCPNSGPTSTIQASTCLNRNLWWYGKSSYTLVTSSATVEVEVEVEWGRIGAFYLRHVTISTFYNNYILLLYS